MSNQVYVPSNALVFAYDRAIGRAFADVLGSKTGFGYSPIDMFSPSRNMFSPFDIPYARNYDMGSITSQLFEVLSEKHDIQYSLYAIQVDCLDFGAIWDTLSQRVSRREAIFYGFSNDPGHIREINAENKRNNLHVKVHGTGSLLTYLHKVKSEHMLDDLVN